MELKYCLVTQNIASVLEDSRVDDDRFPDIELVSGDVTFTPNVPSGSSYQVELTNGQWYSVHLGRIKAKIVNGKIFHEDDRGVYLFAAGSGSNPSKISYSVTYSNLRAGGVPVSLNSFSFQAIPDEEVDLTLVMPVSGASPAGSIRGPRGTSLESIEVEDSNLVFTAVNEAGSFEMARIPISHVVEAEAREAARQAAEGVAEITASNLAASESFKNQAGAHADRAEAAADDTVADARAQLVGYVEDAQTSATSAGASDKSAAAHRAAAKTSETNAKSSETKAKASETKATTEANRSETARTGSEAAQGKAESAAVKAEGMRDSAATHSASASRSESAASKSASNAKASETRAQELADAFDVEAIRAEIEARIADLVDGAPDALNTLREIAELASSNKTVQEQLTEAIAGKADKTHTHSQSQVTGLSTALGKKADKTHTHETSQVVGLDNALAGKADKAHTHAQGDISGLSTSLSNKADKTHTHSQSQITGLSTALSGKADKSHTHAWSSITGRPDVPVTDVGYRIRTAEDDPSAYPAGVSISMSAGDQGWTDALRADDPDYVYDGFVVILTIRNGSYTQSAYQMVYSYTSVTRPVYIRKYNGTGNGWSTFRKLSDDGHTHVSADITDTTNYFGSALSADKIPKTNSDGQLHSSQDPSSANHLVRKSWVDKEVAKKANTSHTHAQSDITGLSTVLNNKAAKTHSHTTADITDFSTEMGKKANKSHTHSQSDITGLSTTLSGKADSTHTHTQGEVTGLTTALNGKAAKSHKHTTADITDFSTEMGKKANTSHTHTQAQVSGLSTALSKKADKTYVNSRPALFSGSGAPPSSIPGAVAGDFWLDTDTMELHKITGV